MFVMTDEGATIPGGLTIKPRLARPTTALPNRPTSDASVATVRMRNRLPRTRTHARPNLSSENNDGNDLLSALLDDESFSWSQKNSEQSQRQATPEQARTATHQLPVSPLRLQGEETIRTSTTTSMVRACSSSAFDDSRELVRAAGVEHHLGVAIWLLFVLCIWLYVPFGAFFIFFLACLPKKEARGPRTLRH